MANLILNSEIRPTAAGDVDAMLALEKANPWMAC